jgi:hypothetical protein
MARPEPCADGDGGCGDGGEAEPAVTGPLVGGRLTDGAVGASAPPVVPQDARRRVVTSAAAGRARRMREE